MSLVIQKFGGSSLQTVDRVKSAASHVASCWQAGEDVVVVVSAMGKQTDQLTALAREVSQTPPAREVDMLLTAGERISMALMAIALDAKGVPSISLTGSQVGIITDSIHGNARIKKILGDRVREGLGERKVVIVAGFQGVSDKAKNVTTLGRGGSDLTAVALSVALGADRCELYKDVDGLFTAHPRVVGAATKIEEINWDHAEVLARSGAGVLHSRAAFLSKKFSVPLEIRSSINLTQRGTLLSGGTVESSQVVSITSQSDLAYGRYRIENSTTRKTMVLVSEWLRSRGATPILLQQKLSAEGEELEISYPQSLKGDFELFCSEHPDFSLKDIFSIDDLSSITIVGPGIVEGSDVVSKLFDLLDTAPAAVIPRSQDITILVDSKSEENSIRTLHKHFIER